MADDMVWVPTVDGGTLQLPASDPRAQAYLAQRRQQTKPQQKPAKAQDNSAAGSSSGQPSSFSPQALKEAHRKNQIARDEMIEAETRYIFNMVFREFARRYARQNSVLDTDFYSAPDDEDHDRAVLEVIEIVMGWAAESSNDQDAQLIEARTILDGFRERGADIQARPPLTWSPEDRSHRLPSMSPSIFAQSLILRDAERYMWGRSGAQEFDAQNNWLINSHDWWAADRVYEARKALSMALGNDWAKGGKQVFSPLGGDFWFRRGLEDHSQLDSDPSRPRTPLPPTYQRIWMARAQGR